MPRDRNYQGFVKALDELLGSNRNGDGVDMAMKDFRDDDVCKMSLVGLCPYTLFSNTREDIGTCPKMHHEKLNASYNAVKETQNFGFEEELEHYLADFISKCERANETRKRRRIADGIDSQDPAELAKETELAATIMRNSNLMRDLMEETEKLAEAGDLDASMEAMSKIETLRVERTAAQAEAKRIEEEKRATHPESKLRMCEQCGAFLSIYDNETRLADHFMGKLHLGYVKIREMHAKLAATRRAGDKREDMRGRARESRLEERPSDRERSDRERSDRERSDRERSDRDRSDRDRGDSYRNDRDRDRGGDRDRGRDSYSRDSYSRGGPAAPPPLQQFTFAPPPVRGDDRDRGDRGRDVRPRYAHLCLLLPKNLRSFICRHDEPPRFGAPPSYDDRGRGGYGDRCQGLSFPCFMNSLNSPMSSQGPLLKVCDLLNEISAPINLPNAKQHLCTTALQRRPLPRPRPLARPARAPLFMGLALALACSELGFMTVSSTERIRHAASVAALMALRLTRRGSQTKLSYVSQMPSFSTSTPNHLPPLWCSARSLFKMSVESYLN